MVMMVIDHETVYFNAWPHGTPSSGSEMDGVVVHGWNRPLAVFIRNWTHLCAPGFTFLLGVGIAYFGRSRSLAGWTARQMAWHFLVRAIALTAVTVSMGLLFSGFRVWFLNQVLFALAVDYLIAGCAWLLVNWSEKKLASVLVKCLPDGPQDDAASAPLLGGHNISRSEDKKIRLAVDISWHLHNILLLVLAGITIWWNIWISPTGGYCSEEKSTATDGFWDHPMVRIWFHSVITERVMSNFPPMAWLSFAILGVLYGRILLARPWKTSTQVKANVTLGLVSLCLFVATRLLHFGNLSENCLRLPEQEAHPGTNQYLASVQSFLYVVKYPPEPAFAFYTMTGNFFLLALFGSIRPAAASRYLKPLLVYGTSALFFYVVHILLLTVWFPILMPIFGHKVGRIDGWSGEDQGIDQLWIIFPLWFSILAVLYPLCRRYSAFKSTTAPNSIWRFF
jgi:hypothetical protein